MQEDAASQSASHAQGDKGHSDHTHTHEEHSHSHSHSDSESSSSHSEHSHSHTESHTHSHSHDHGHDHVHDDQVSSVSASVTGDLGIDKLNQFLGGLLSLVGPDLYRYKGICAMEGEDMRFVFQVINSIARCKVCITTVPCAARNPHTFTNVMSNVLNHGRHIIC